MRNFSREEIRKVMKFIKHTVFTLLLLAGLSVAAMAQRDGDRQKPPPPKGNPPVVVPGKGNPPPRESPKGDDKHKKPGGYEAVLRREDLLTDLA